MRGAVFAVVQPGATWHDFDQATQPHGLATTGGLISNLIAADATTTDGESVRASERDDAGLFSGCAAAAATSAS